MPKRHRQPEPIDIAEAGNVLPSSSPGSGNGVVKAQGGEGGRQVNTSGSAVSESANDVVFPATPSTLATDRKARLQRARAAATAMEDYGDVTSSAEDDSVKSSLESGEVDFDSSELGDDGNQEDDSVGDILEEDSDEDGDYEAFLGRGNGARRGAGQGSSDASDSETSGEEMHDDDDDEDEEGSDDEGSEMDSDVDEEDSDLDSSGDDDDQDDESEEGEEGADAPPPRRRKLRGIPSSSDGEEGDFDAQGTDGPEDDDSSEDEAGGQVTVDFGVYDMKRSHVDAVVHLMDQLCPDKMDEVDRDDLGAALAENRYTYIVKVNDNEEEEDEEEGVSDQRDAAAEVYGLASVLDVAHGVQSHPAAFKALYTLLHKDVWRTVAHGIPPAELLLSTTADGADDDEDDDGNGSNADSNAKSAAARAAKRSKTEKYADSTEAPGLAKCVLLVSEYIRNVPIELTVQIYDDLANRVEDDAKKGDKARLNEEEKEEGKRVDAVRATPGCMIAVLAKVQRMVDPPVSLTEGKKKKGKHAVTEEDGKDGQDGTAKTELLDLSRYAFWREEDNVLFDFRDKRVAALAYKCRPQYEGQPEQDIPLSVLFVLQHGAFRQAIAEMKRRATISAAITRY